LRVTTWKPRESGLRGRSVEAGFAVVAWERACPAITGKAGAIHHLHRGASPLPRCISCTCTCTCCICLACCRPAWQFP